MTNRPPKAKSRNKSMGTFRGLYFRGVMVPANIAKIFPLQIFLGLRYMTMTVVSPVMYGYDVCLCELYLYTYMHGVTIILYM